MSEMTAEMVIAALKAGQSSPEWQDVLEWTDWATGDEVRQLAQIVTNYISQNSPHWESVGDNDYWVSIPGIRIRLVRGWRGICSDDFFPCVGWPVRPHEVRFVVDQLLEI
jgi:hypothetical protein